jgi:Flp pilus assembly protein TadG
VVEFTLILPVFLLMTLGVVDLARVFTSYISLTNAVREGALYAGESDGYTKTDGILTTIVQEMGDTSSADLTVSTPLCRSTWSSGDFAAGATACPSTANPALKFVQVSATYQVTVVTPLLSNILGQTVTISASTAGPIVSNGAP